MSSDPFGGQQQQRGRRPGLFGNIRWWVLLAFAGYAAFYWFSNRSVDPYTGESVL
ncbi:MAG: M48 family peptidase, partial [Stenotrophomonas sp.]